MKNKLSIFETIKLSADELLKNKPEQIEFLQPTEDEPNNFNMDINGITVHGVRTHKITYVSGMIFVKFFDKNNKRIATLSLFGSNENKKDEFLYVGFGKVCSGTTLRRIISDIDINELIDVVKVE
jgi:hypothetical protein